MKSISYFSFGKAIKPYQEDNVQPLLIDRNPEFAKFLHEVQAHVYHWIIRQDSGLICFCQDSFRHGWSPLKTARHIESFHAGQAI